MSGGIELSAIETVKVPNIGDFDSVEIIEIQVKPGDEIAVEDPLITLETEKAAMDVPSPVAGLVESLSVKEGDKVSEGDIILKVKTKDNAAKEQDEQKTAEPPAESSKAKESQQDNTAQKQPSAKAEKKTAAKETLKTIHLPQTDDFKDVSIIEILVAVGDTIEQEQSIVAVESEKASVELPSDYAGVVKELLIGVGQKANPGDPVLKVLTTETQETEQQPTAEKEQPEIKQEAESGNTTLPTEQPKAEAQPSTSTGLNHAGPATRKFARALGADLAKIKGSGHKGRITKVDVEQYVKSQLKSLESGGGVVSTGLPALPEVDFTQFGPVDAQPMSRIKKLTARNMFRNWVNIPHVTQFDEADITELELFRKANKPLAQDQGISLTPLCFILKAVVDALKTFKQFNASLSADGEQIIYKQYFHIGVAVDTPNGLLVPVIKDVDQKGLFELAKDIIAISEKAQKGTLKAQEMQGQTFTVSSLGNKGGTQFTPIINAPDVAILGVSKLQIKPKLVDQSFEQRKMLPLALSYDHRVIDGVEGAKFLQHICAKLQDIRKLLL